MLSLSSNPDTKLSVFVFNTAYKAPELDPRIVSPSVNLPST